MKIFYSIISLIFLSGSCFSQNTSPSVFYINQVPQQGILLNRDWKFQAGDNIDYARPDYDDNNWKAFDPTLSINKQPGIAASGISWLRLKLALSDHLQREQFAFLIRQYVASEIYLNGRLIYRFGTIGTNLEKTSAYNPESLPVSLPVDFKGNQVLAVRYAVPYNLLNNYDGSTPMPLLAITLLTSDAAFKLVKITQRHLPVTNTLRIGAYGILAFLYLAFFLYNPSHKAYLFFFLFAIFEIPTDIFQLNYPADVKNILLLSRVYYILWNLSQLFQLTAMYLLLNQKRGVIYWSLLILSISGIFINRWVFGELIVVNLINLELVRTCFKTLKRKTRGSWIITAGALSFLLLIGAFYIGVYFNMDYYWIPIGESFTMADILYGAGQLSIPIATTIYVALEFGFTSHALTEKLIEVERLSQKSIAQEKEKQQIIAMQNETLERQVEERTSELSQSLDDLRSTQQQLIQSEKMASLGELTAGIAHEIQNPLNFVNNFSEVNNELIEELKIKNPNGQELLNDIYQNNEKIILHGKRADAIVKGMLQHSRTSTGQKELTDINALVDEYLRLAYHGLRAKDKSFNAKFETDFDSSVGKVNIIPQDIGRVLLNLINNAFYAVNEKKKNHELSAMGYEPLVTVQTKKINNKVEIKVIDNGNGIPDSIKEKIFQPFFTTKPTGQGTGLGLSLSYDIVKAHRGEIRIETKDREGSAFIIILSE